MEGNREAGGIYFMARSQVIAGVGGVIDLNFSSVKELMRTYKIRDHRGCWERIHHAFHELRKEEGK